MRKLFTKAAVAAAAALGLASSANAYLVLSITDQMTSTTFTCNTFSGGCNSFFVFTAPNSIGFLGSVGNFDVGFSTATSNAPGTATLATANTATTTISRNDGGTGVGSLLISLVAYDFNSPTGTDKTLDTSVTPSTTQGFNNASEKVAVGFFVNSDNINNRVGILGSGNTTSLTCTYTPSNPTGCFNAGSTVWSDPASSQPGFSMMSLQQFTILSRTTINTSTSMSVQNVPEPLTVSLVGAALLAAGVASRRKSKQ